MHTVEHSAYLRGEQMHKCMSTKPLDEALRNKGVEHLYGKCIIQYSAGSLVIVRIQGGTPSVFELYKLRK